MNEKGSVRSDENINRRILHGRGLALPATDNFKPDLEIELQGQKVSSILAAGTKDPYLKEKFNEHIRQQKLVKF